MTDTAAPDTRITPFPRLGDRELTSWLEIRSANPGLDSPFFHPGFSSAVQASGMAVNVVVATERSSNAVIGLWPLELTKRSARPVGWPGADFQGPLLAAGHAFELPKLLGDLGLRTLTFDHAHDGLAELEPWIHARHVSPHMDVSGGLDRYVSRLSRSGKDNVSQARRKNAKAARELGTVRFLADSTDPRLLDEVIELKRRQYAATGARDYFADPRRRELAHRLLSTRDPSFGGMLSAVYAGPHLLAAHFGLRAGPVLHWWFPVYEPALSRFAPGWILLRELVAVAPELGFERIDLGRGDDEYKRRAMTGHTVVCEGIVSTSPFQRAGAVVRRRAVGAVKSSPLGPRLTATARSIRSARQSPMR
jgi:CelD/BcsL family acetyltransferase involved in cellulose biosynthesis